MIPFPHGEAETEPHRRSQLTGPLAVPYKAFFTGVDASLPGKAWARSSEAMQIKKHTTLTSNRFRCGRFTAKNSFVARLR
jgi:hypothetical protein